MTKSELIDRVAAGRNLPRRTAEEVVNIIFDGMRDALCNGERIEIRGFGTFKTRHYDGYTGRNPKTSQSIEVAAKVLPVFKVGKELRVRVNGGSE
ncbi:MAG: integration host factor subunit beta [Proteobacteria bacterium]|nr:integration host factor subunit beta [Pseudomonadota bacterium]MCP4920145.1 integration host factor subunit beta [Pseudomonadota bacterium]